MDIVSEMSESVNPKLCVKIRWVIFMYEADGTEIYKEKARIDYNKDRILDYEIKS